jgi:hypothetical protein
LPKLERNCQKSKEVEQELSPRCFDLEELEKLQQTSKGIDGSVFCYLVCRKLVERDYENMKSESMMAISELFDLK